MKTVIGCLFIAGGLFLGIWLALYVMLYGGIMQAVDNWGVDKSAVVWGIIRAVFFEMGAIPGYLLAVIGVFIFSLGD